MAEKNLELRDKVDALKVEGNTLFGRKNYQAAIEKFTAGLKLDDKHAILYCNRAACHLALSKYVEASEDAKLAIKYDPEYIKAYGRLASAFHGMGSPDAAVDSWQKAIDLISKGDMGPEQKKLRDSFAASMKASRGAFAEAQKTNQPPWLVSSKDNVLPWQVAEAMLPGLQAASRPFSSAWVISCAYKDFKMGLDWLDELKEKDMGGDQGPMLGGKVGALTHLSNGIIRDRRVFHGDRPVNEFFIAFQQQVKLETMYSDAWTTGTPEEVIRQAQARLRKQGWTKTRPALSVSVRARFMRGFLQSGSLDRPDLGVQFIGHALDIVKLGRKQWPNASPSDRGVIFSDTFLFGLQNEWLDQYYKAYAARREDPNSPYSLEDLKKEAESVIHAIDSDPSLIRDMLQREADTGFQLSFIAYPKVNAYAVLGFYYAEKARGVADSDVAEWRAHLDNAIANYIMAARSVPEDDVYHLGKFNLNARYSLRTNQCDIAYFEYALQHQTNRQSTLKVTYPVIQKITRAYPQVKKLWAYSSLFRNRDPQFQEVIKAEAEISEMLAQGTISMNDVYEYKW
ncbi:hypothetical protein ONZ45_g15127 [Pleurotus djamor]|nr:hypothetical protein ONZ45_g15127 [Pleurotus djamor]